jgi:hypothetical protein
MIQMRTEVRHIQIARASINAGGGFGNPNAYLIPAQQTTGMPTAFVQANYTPYQPTQTTGD